MKIGFDIDGTILTPHAKIEKLKEINEKFSVDLYDEYPAWESLRKHGLLPENFCKECFYKENRKHMLSSGSFYESFKTLFEKLSSSHEIFFVTARKPSDKEWTESLFEKNGIPFKNVHFVGEGTSKVPKLKELGIEVFFEDNGEVTKDVLENTDIQMYLLSRTYNKKYNFKTQNFKRIKDFSEVHFN